MAQELDPSTYIMNVAAILAVLVVTAFFFYLVNFKERWGRWATASLNLVAFATAFTLITQAVTPVY